MLIPRSRLSAQSHRLPRMRYFGQRKPSDEAADQTLDISPAAEGPRGGSRYLCERPSGTLPAHGGGNSCFAARTAPFSGHGRKLAPAPARAQTVSDRAGAGAVIQAGSGLAPSRVAARAPQDSRLQFPPGAASSRLEPSLSPFLAWRAARPHLPAPLVVALAETRTFGQTRGDPPLPWPQHGSRPPARRCAFSVLSISAFPWRRGPNFPHAPGAGRRVRR